MTNDLANSIEIKIVMASLRLSKCTPTAIIKPFKLMLVFLSIFSVCFGQSLAAKQEVDDHKKELRYRTVLFHLYTEDYLTALNKFKTFERLNQLPSNDIEMESMLTGIYLSYGLYDKAEQIFQSLQKRNIPLYLTDLTWFYLTKIQLQKGDLQAATSALANVETHLPNAFRDEYYYLQAYLNINNSNFNVAADFLKKISKLSDWRFFGQFNLGMSLINEDDRDKGIAMLASVGEIDSEAEDIVALKDKANLTLGYLFLREKNSDLAIRYLEKVRLHGLFSNKALLGLGWAHSNNQQFERALVPWLELSQRDFLDATVQEALLAAPYAFSQLNALSQALDFYQKSIDRYEQIQKKFDQLLNTVRQGDFFSKIIIEGQFNDVALSRYLGSIAETDNGQFIQFLLKNKNFQNVFANYRDLLVLKEGIVVWRNNLDIYDNSIKLRTRLFKKTLPELQQKLRSSNQQVLKKKYDWFASRINKISKNGNFVAVANEHERNQLLQFELLDEKIQSLPAKYNSSLMHQRLKVLQGTLLWNIFSKFEERVHHIKQSMLSIDEGLLLLDRQKNILDDASNFNSNDDVLSSKSMFLMQERMQQSWEMLTQLINKHEVYLQHIASIKLRQQQQQIVTYLAQVRFAIAQILDRSTEAGEKP